MPASLGRRLGAIGYDGLLVLALMFLASLPFVAVRGGEPVEAGDPVYQLAMLAVAYVFFTGFWVRAGRTLGMQSWGLRLETEGGDRPGLARASLRFVAAILSWLPAGLGFWWQLWDRDGLCWHDRLSRTCLRFYPRRPQASGSSEPVQREHGDG
ncbi:MAG: RDD family protein [Gammaproteobacteria bacterium]